MSSVTMRSILKEIGNTESKIKTECFEADKILQLPFNERDTIRWLLYRK